MRNLIPAINGEYTEKEGLFILPECLTISDVYPAVVRVFSSRIRKMADCTVVPSKDMPIVLYIEEKELSEEAYKVKIEADRVILNASSERGFANALISFYQLLAKGGAKTGCGEFYDEPKYSQRGFMLDCCRHFFPIEDIKKILEQCALLKFTHFHWHLSEDQGFRIESKKFPKLNSISSYRELDAEDPLVKRGIMKEGERYGGYYTQEEIRDLIQFAAERQIEVYPEIDLPGHSVAALAAYPELSCSKEPGKVTGKFGIFERIFCAGKEETYKFLFELLDEICELFPSAYFHLGGDEAPKSEWEKCPDCNRVMKEKGFTDYEELQAYFTSRLINHLKGKGKTPVVWNEAAESGNLDRDAVLQYWIEEGQSYTADEIKKNRKFILSNVSSFYCDYAYEYVTLENTLMYEPQVQGKPIPAENILGVEAPMWTEQTPFCEDIEKMINPRLLAVAENGWTRKRNYTDFLLRMEKYQNCNTLNFLKELAPGEKMGVAYIFES